MSQSVFIWVVSTLYVCSAANIPSNSAFSSYNDEAPAASNTYFLQTAATSFPQKPTIQTIEQGNELPVSQFGQLPPTFLNEPSPATLPARNRYFVDFPQFFDRSAAQAQSATGTTLPASNSQSPNSQAFSGQLNQQQQQSPLGVLFSAATDVSQFHFSGNGVNYSF